MGHVCEPIMCEGCKTFFSLRGAHDRLDHENVRSVLDEECPDHGRTQTGRYIRIPARYIHVREYSGETLRPRVGTGIRGDADQEIA